MNSAGSGMDRGSGGSDAAGRTGNQKPRLQGGGASRHPKAWLKIFSSREKEGEGAVPVLFRNLKKTAQSGSGTFKK